MTEKLCPSCNRLLPDDAPAGLCPVCALSAAHEPPARRPLLPLEEIQEAFPQFEILACIGHGGMGVVYKVRQRQLGRVLALKILLPGLSADPGFAVRFEREARVLAKLSHPGIVSIFDYGDAGGLCWLTMEYVEGVNLRQAMQAARFTPEQALAVIPELCAALQYAHEQGVLHRDIKPENILLDAAGKVKIVDFGIARLVGEESTANTVLTYTGSALGSPAYAAPEQIEQPHRVDHRADLYSLGVVLYEMLTGELPLGRFPAPSRKTGSPPQLDQVVFRTLEKEPDERYQSADEMRKGVEDASSGNGADESPSQPLAAGSRASGGGSIPVWLVVMLAVAGLWLFSVMGLTVGRVLQLPPFFVSSLIFALIPVLLVAIGAGWYYLRKARQGRIRRHPAAVVFGVWLPVVGVAVLASLFRLGMPHFRSFGKGDLVLNMAEAFGTVLVLALPMLWFGDRPQVSSSKRLRRWLAAGTLLLMTATLLCGKRLDGRWPFANFYGELSISRSPGSREWEEARYTRERERNVAENNDEDMAAWDRQHPLAENPILVKIREANSLFGGRLEVKEIGLWFAPVTIGFTTRNGDEWKKEAKAICRDLERTLPAPAAAEAMGSYDDVSSKSFKLHGIGTETPPLPWGLIAGSSLSGVLAAWLASRRDFLPVALFGAGLAVAFGTPVWVRAGDLEADLLAGPPPAIPAFHITPDFSTPVSAVQTMLDAGWAGDADLFRKGFSAKCTVRRGLSNVILGDGAVMRLLPHFQAQERLSVDENTQSFEEQGPDGRYLRTAVRYRGGRDHGSGTELGVRNEGGEWRISTIPEGWLDGH